MRGRAAPKAGSQGALADSALRIGGCRMACTGRHYSLVALKPGEVDGRFVKRGAEYGAPDYYGQPDTHM